LKAENVILDKSFKFGLRILKLYIHLRKKKVDGGLSSQILDSGASIGANVEEAVEVPRGKILLTNFRLHTKNPGKRNIG